MEWYHHYLSKSATLDLLKVFVKEYLYEVTHRVSFLILRNNFRSYSINMESKKSYILCTGRTALYTPTRVQCFNIIFGSHSSKKVARLNLTMYLLICYHSLQFVEGYYLDLYHVNVIGFYKKRIAIGNYFIIDELVGDKPNNKPRVCP